MDSKEFIIEKIEQNKNLNHRTIICLSGERNVNLENIVKVCKPLGAGRKSLLYLYVKDNKLRKETIKQNKLNKTNKPAGIVEEVKKILPRKIDGVIQFCLYKQSESILGKTFDICVFHNFYELKPNVLARGMETVRGGGLIIFLTPPKLELDRNIQLKYDNRNMSPRFLHRFMVQSMENSDCIWLDSKMELMNKNKSIKNIKSITKKKSKKMNDLIDDLAKSDISIGFLFRMCATMDQVKCLKSLIVAYRTFDKRDNSDENHKQVPITATLIADRGRGKSASLGLAICALLLSKETDIYIISTHPDNILSVWDFLQKALKANQMATDLVFQYSVNKYNERTIIGATFNDSRITFVDKNNYETLKFAEYVIIDEAASLSYSLINFFVSEYRGVLFLSSTTCGYEGTGMTFKNAIYEKLCSNNKLIENDDVFCKLEDNQRGLLFDIKMQEPIRYGKNDCAEKFLFGLLCLKSSIKTEILDEMADFDIDNLNVFNINKNKIIGGGKENNVFLQKIMSVYYASNVQTSTDHFHNIADNNCVNLLVLTSSGLDSENPTVLGVMEIILQGDIVSKYPSKNTFFSDDVYWTCRGKSNTKLWDELSGWRINWLTVHPNYRNRGLGKTMLKKFVEHVQKKPKFMKITRDSELLLELDTLPYFRTQYITAYTIMTKNIFQFWKSAASFKLIFMDLELDEITSKPKGTIIARIQVNKESFSNAILLDEIYDLKELPRS